MYERIEDWLHVKRREVAAEGLTVMGGDPPRTTPIGNHGGMDRRGAWRNWLGGDS